METPCGIYELSEVHNVTGETSICSVILDNDYHVENAASDLLNYEALQASDEDWELIQESNCSSGHWGLEHRWSINLGAANMADRLLLNLDAHVHPGGEPMNFFWTSDGVTLNYLLTVSNTEPDLHFTVDLPVGTSGTIWIVVQDTDSQDSVSNNSLRGQVCINRMYVASMIENCEPCIEVPAERYVALSETGVCSNLLDADYHSTENSTDALDYLAVGAIDSDWELVQENYCPDTSPAVAEGVVDLGTEDGQTTPGMTAAELARARGYWDMDHSWHFDLGNGAQCNRLVVHFVGHVHPYGEPMEFFWTTDGVTLNPLFTLTDAEPDVHLTADLPLNLTGPVSIVLRDTFSSDSASNYSIRDQVCVNALYIECTELDCDPCDDNVSLGIEENISEWYEYGFTESGSREQLFISQNQYEILEEEYQNNGGTWHWGLMHKWGFDLDPCGGGRYSFRVEAHVDIPGEGFDFFWSSDGANFNYMLTVTDTIDDHDFDSFELPEGLTGPIEIYVVDASQSDTNSNWSGNRHRLWIDRMFIECNRVGCPPCDPNVSVGTSETIEEISVVGEIVEGNHWYVHQEDDLLEHIGEDYVTVGNSSYWDLEHKWRFNVAPCAGARLVVGVEASYTNASEGAIFYWSANGVDFIEMFQVTNTDEPLTMREYELPVGLSGDVWIMARDRSSNDTNSNISSRDFLHVDRLLIDCRLVCPEPNDADESWALYE